MLERPSPDSAGYPRMFDRMLDGLIQLDLKRQQEDREPQTSLEILAADLIGEMSVPDVPAEPERSGKYEVRFHRNYTVREGFTRIISAPSKEEAEAAAANLASEFNSDCPDDCSEIEGGDGADAFETDYLREVSLREEPDYFVAADGQILPWED